MTDYHPPEHPELDYYDDIDGVPCPKCYGFGTVDCDCCGDFCCCENGGDRDCPVCHGEGEISEERNTRYEENQREWWAVFEAAKKACEK